MLEGMFQDSISNNRLSPPILNGDSRLDFFLGKLDSITTLPKAFSAIITIIKRVLE